MIARETSALLFLDVFRDYLEDRTVTEIAVNRPGEVWFEQAGYWRCAALPGVDKPLLESLGVAVSTFTHQKWDMQNPLLSASLPNGERIQLVMPPAVEGDCISMTLRKPSFVSLSLADFSAAGLFKQIRLPDSSVNHNDIELARLLSERNYEAFFRLAVHARKNIVVSGPTGSGKTTFMKGLVQEIPHEERLITIEDVRELFLPHPNRVHLLYSKGQQGATHHVTPKNLLESCLRMKPDRILLAELRGDECLYYVRNAASGHPGSITSCHAGSAMLAFEQLAIMIQDSPAGAALSFEVIQRLLRLTIDVVVQFQCQAGNRFISEVYFNSGGAQAQTHHA